MRVSPILFSGPMVRAILREIEEPGTGKTQTRRVLTPQPEPDMGLIGLYAPRLTAVFGYVTPDADCKIPLRYIPSDRLYIREEYSFDHSWTGVPPRDVIPASPVWYWADGNPDYGDWTKPKRSIHMPRWASRITLVVTDVRVERLQDISEADAIAEGIYGHHSEELGCTLYSYDTPGHVGFGCRTSITVRPAGWDAPRHAFLNLWDKVNGSGAWDANPWIVAVTFHPYLINVDAFLANREAA